MTSAHSMLDQYAKANFQLCGYHFLDLEKFCTESLYSKEIQQRTAGNFIDSIPAWIQDARRMTIHGDAFQLNTVLGRIRRAAGLLCIEPLQALIFSLEKTSAKIYQESYVASVWKALDQIEQLLTEAKEYLETMEAGKSYGA
jgi:hypothetical protein